MAPKLTVPNMACSACSDTITQAIKAIDLTATLQADTETKLVNLETQAITDAGYTVA